VSISPVVPELVVRGACAPAATIRLCDWSRTDAYEVEFAVVAVDDDLRARTGPVTMSDWSSTGRLDDFLHGLARDFRGWAGERSWVNNQLVVTAVFATGGHVHLGWTLRPGFAPGDWHCTVTTVLEAGEELTTVATDVREFLHQG
jgi:Family of unknown function (DUF6228)